MQDSEIVEETEKSWSELTGKILDWVDSIVLNLPNFLIAILVIILFVIFAKYASKLVDKIFRKSSAQDSIRTVSV
jgi:small conductance mechanosensitive channel